MSEPAVHLCYTFTAKEQGGYVLMVSRLQVFDAFLHSFTTYRSLLMRIKGVYDTALDDALASVFDNVHMQADLAMSEPKMVGAWASVHNQSFGTTTCAL